MDVQIRDTLKQLRDVYADQMAPLITHLQAIQKLEGVITPTDGSSMRIVGIDPGTQGAIVSLCNGEVEMHQMPDNASDIVTILAQYDISNCHVFLEKAQAMTKKGIKQGASSMFSYGQGFGILLGILTTLKIPYTLVPPQTWSKVMHAGTTSADAKARSLEAARRLFPQVQFIRPKCKKPDSGYIDAILIAEYGRRQLRE